MTSGSSDGIAGLYDERPIKSGLATNKARALAIGVSDRHFYRLQRNSEFIRMVEADYTVHQVLMWLHRRREGGLNPHEVVSHEEIRKRKALAVMLKAEEDAIVAKLKRQEAEGLLLTVEDVKQRWWRIMTITKNRVMGVGPQIRQELVPYLRDQKDVNQIEHIIVEHMREALIATADELERIKKLEVEIQEKQDEEEEQNRDVDGKVGSDEAQGAEVGEGTGRSSEDSEEDSPEVPTVDDSEQRSGA